MRVLRRYQHVAQKEHWCFRCTHWIQPGEIYEGEVTVSREYFYVLKYHVYPMCDYPPDLDEDKYLSSMADVPLLKAA